MSGGDKERGTGFETTTVTLSNGETYAGLVEHAMPKPHLWSDEIKHVNGQDKRRVLIGWVHHLEAVAHDHAYSAGYRGWYGVGSLVLMLDGRPYSGDLPCNFWGVDGSHWGGLAETIARREGASRVEVCRAGDLQQVGTLNWQAAALELACTRFERCVYRGGDPWECSILAMEALSAYHALILKQLEKPYVIGSRVAGDYSTDELPAIMREWLAERPNHGTATKCDEVIAARHKTTGAALKKQRQRRGVGVKRRKAKP